MLWNSRSYAGFSQVRPWLPVDSGYKNINVRSQMNDRYSILNLYRNVLHLRRKYKALNEGEIVPVMKGFKGVLAYLRIYGDERFFIALNFSSREKRVHAEERGQWRVMFSTHRTRYEHFTSLNITLAPYEAMIVMRIGEL
jgi:alpha-glucosidase